MRVARSTVFCLITAKHLPSQSMIGTTFSACCSSPPRTLDRCLLARSPACPLARSPACPLVLSRVLSASWPALCNTLGDATSMRQVCNVFDFLIPASPAVLAFIILLRSWTSRFARVCDHSRGKFKLARRFLIDHRHRKN